MWTKLWGPIKCGQALKAAVQYYRTPISLLNAKFWLQNEGNQCYFVSTQGNQTYFGSETEGNLQNYWVLISMLTSGSCN